MSRFEDTLVDVLVDRARTVIRGRGAGHCAQVPHVPSALADRVCESLHKGASDNERICLATDRPTRAWHASPAKIVEYRNEVEAGQGKLIVLVPAGRHLPAEDSFGVTTFEVIDTTDVYHEARRQSMEKLRELDPVVADKADRVLAEAQKTRDFGVSEDAAARFASDVLSRPNATGVGLAMTDLGLIPDTHLLDADDQELGPRLRRNLQQMERLSAAEAPADRVRNVVTGDDEEAEALRPVLMQALEDAPTDRWSIAERLGRLAESDGGALGALVSKEAAAPVIHTLQILRLEGDLEDGDPQRTRTRQPRIKAVIRCTPPARTIVGLDHLRLSLLHRPERSTELIEAGVQKTKRVGALGRTSDFSWSLRLDVDELESGLYLLRVEAVDEDNFIRRQADSEPFAIREADPADVPVERDVTGVMTAAFHARKAAGRPPGPPTIAYAPPKDRENGSLHDHYIIRFEHAPGSYRLVLPRALSKIEGWSIAQPRDPFNWPLSSDGQSVLDGEAVQDLPEEFLDAREEALRAIEANQLVVGDGVPLCVATCDLSRVDDAAQLFSEAWRSALERSPSERTREALLNLDRVTIEGLDDCLLVGPTHPLRLAWLVRYHESLAGAAADEDIPDHDIERLVRLTEDLSPQNVPHVLVSGGRELRYLESLTLHWGIWAHPSSPVGATTAADIRARLVGTGRALGSVSAADVVARLRRYLATHPYVTTLQLNVVNPGGGELVLETLLALQSDPALASVRYVIRLFATELSRSRLGATLDAFMADPEGIPARRRDAADAFLASTDDVLAPKLTYSKHRLDELAAAPERFPAHLTLFLDWFALDAVPVPPLEDRRSFFADGVLVDPVIIFREGDERFDPQWDEHVVVPQGPDPFAAAYRAGQLATSTLLGSDVLGTVPAVRLRLDRVRRTILDAVHRTSDWVVVIDPVFTEEFLDSQREGDDTPRYLIDADARESQRTARNIVVSTRSRLELSELLRPALQSYALDVVDDRIDALLDAMHALNPGLALRLLNVPHQAVEALTVGLAAMELEAQGTLRRSLVIPLDLHQDLFREELEFGVGGVEALSRTDLAIVRPHPDRRALDVHLVEVKARGDLPASLPTTFLDGIKAQLDNSQAVLRSTLLGLDAPSAASELMASLRARRLMRVLARYAERALRYGYLHDGDDGGVRRLLTSLDSGFEAMFALHALVFDLGESGVEEELRFGDVNVHRLPRSRAVSLLESAPTRLQTLPALRPIPDQDILDTAVPSERTSVPAITDEAVGGPPPVQSEVPADQAPTTGTGSPSPEPPSDQAADLPDGPSPDDVLLIGQASASLQFGVIGHLRANDRPVAFDVDGTNVVSIFGVQGAGKSYTVGDLIEAALIREPALNRLKRPLGVVVFHYSNNQGYLPEFASMIDGNDEPGERQALEQRSAAPHGIDDVRLVVPADLVDERTDEFGGRIPVHPLMLSPEDLVLNDWKLLMGVEEGEQMYVKTMTTLLKSQRRDLSLHGLREAVADSRLSPAQKNNADIRLDFVANFVSDQGGLTDVMQPGRLVIVDVRDPLMEQGEALALFMVLLRAFSEGPDAAGRAFNRLVVFDEAHKYMGNPRLTKAIVEAIREMRHKGTSVVIASQNPPSVPKEVIELSSVLVAHRFTSPQWLDHVKKVNAAFAADITPPQLAKLESGEAYVYSNGGDVTFRRPQLVRMRPRMTRHGGATRRAVGDG